MADGQMTQERAQMLRFLHDAETKYGHYIMRVLQGHCVWTLEEILDSYTQTDCIPYDPCDNTACRTTFMIGVNYVYGFTAEKMGINGRQITLLQIAQFLHMSGLTPKKHGVELLKAITFHLLDAYERVLN